MEGGSLKDAKEWASELDDHRQGCASQRILGDDHNLVGAAGEQAFSEFCGIEPSWTKTATGDKGLDFQCSLAVTVDVKTARKPYNLIVEEGKVVSDIYILARYHDDTETGTLLGWRWGIDIRQAPVRDFGYGVMNHYMPRATMFPMDALDKRLIPCG